MTNRVLIGKSGSDYVLKISQPGDSGGVLSPNEPLLFDSATYRTGEVYAGGNFSSSSGVNWSATKGTLGYIPLIVSSDDQNGNERISSSVYLHEYVDNSGAYYATTTNLEFAQERPSQSNQTRSNVFMMVLRIPCQYGKMTDSSLWD